MAAEARPAPAINTAAAMGEASRGVGLHQTPHEMVYLLRREHPQVALTWSSKFPQKVDKLKLRKRIHLFPVSITLKADYDTNTREFEYGCSVKDSIFGGRFSVNVPEQQIEYQKRVHIPNGTQLVVSGSCTYKERQLQPNIAIQLEWGGSTHAPGLPRGHSNAVWVGNSFDVRHRFSIAKGLGVEIAGNATLPTPAARYSHESGTLSLGQGAFHLHLAEVNAILRL